MPQASPAQIGTALTARRSDAGIVRVSDRDIGGLMLCGEMYGAPYDLLATYLGVREDRLRGIAARWRAAGYAETGRLGPGPAWCWLTRNGLAATGQGFAATPPSLGLLAHLRAVLAARMALESSDAGQAGQPWWRSERRIRAAIGGRVATRPHPRRRSLLVRDRPQPLPGRSALRPALSSTSSPAIPALLPTRSYWTPCPSSPHASPTCPWPSASGSTRPSASKPCINTTHTRSPAVPSSPPAQRKQSPPSSMRPSPVQTLPYPL